MISKSQIKYIRSLQTKKYREVEKAFIAEGIKTTLEILEQAPELITELFCTFEFYEKHELLLSQKKIKVTLIKQQELEQISQLSAPNEVLCVCRFFSRDVISTDFTKGFSFYLDDIRDPGNLGTIIRICSWFGISELFCSPNTVELYNPKCIQSCMGAFLRVRVFYKDLHELIKEKNIDTVLAADMNGNDVYTCNERTGLIVIGNEANGLSEMARSLATQTIRIPSADNRTESLNAAIAASIIASEFFRKSRG